MKLFLYLHAKHPCSCNISRFKFRYRSPMYEPQESRFLPYLHANKFPLKKPPKSVAPILLLLECYGSNKKKGKYKKPRKNSYPQVFNASDIDLIVNASLKRDGQGGMKRAAVTIWHMKVSTKGVFLNDIKRQIWDEGSGKPVYDGTQITCSLLNNRHI